MAFNRFTTTTAGRSLPNRYELLHLTEVKKRRQDREAAAIK